MLRPMALDPTALPDEAQTFVSERRLATLTTVRADGSPHVAPVGFSWDAEAGLVRIITFAGAHKVEHLTNGADPRAAVCQVDGGRWLTFEGSATVTDDPARVAEAVRRYAVRYRQPSERTDRVAIEITVDRVLGRP
jgi:F420H(2)-dependent biliverdin reductase